MTACFVDAWYIIAKISRFDRDHAAVRRLERAMSRIGLITHDGVLMEALAFYSRFGAEMRLTAARTVRELMFAIEVFPADRLLVRAGLDLYQQRLDKAYSLVDCMSMMLMRAQGIEHVLTNDHHFRQEGFTVLSDAP